MDLKQIEKTRTSLLNQLKQKDEQIDVLKNQKKEINSKLKDLDRLQSAYEEAEKLAVSFGFKKAKKKTSKVEDEVVDTTENSVNEVQENETTESKNDEQTSRQEHQNNTFSNNKFDRFFNN